MGFQAWKDAGVNPYGNSIIANGAGAQRELRQGRQVRENHAAGICTIALKTPEPCIKALVEANGALLYQNELDKWHLVTMLMNDEISRTVRRLGWHDDAHCPPTTGLVDEYLKMEKPYDVRTAYTNDFLDKSIKMPPIHPPKLF